jgi:hypothetical protein
MSHGGIDEIEDIIAKIFDDSSYAGEDSQQDLTVFIENEWYSRLVDGSWTREEFDNFVRQKTTDIRNAVAMWSAHYGTRPDSPRPSPGDMGWGEKTIWNQNYDSGSLTGNFDDDTQRLAETGSVVDKKKVPSKPGDDNLGTDLPTTGVLPFTESPEDYGADEGGYRQGIGAFYEAAQEADPTSVFRQYLDRQPYNPMTPISRGYTQNVLGPRAEAQYYTSPTLRGPIEGTAAVGKEGEEGYRAATEGIPMQSFQDFLQRGEVFQDPEEAFTYTGQGENRIPTGRQFLNPTQMLDRFRDIGQRIMSPVWNQGGPTGDFDPLTGPEQFLRDRMEWTTPKEQFEMVQRPTLQGVTAFPGVRGALQNMMDRRFAEQQEAQPATPFLRWWSGKKDPWNWGTRANGV